MLKGKAIRVEGWGRDSDRYWRMMCCDLLVGRGSGSFPLVVMFDPMFDSIDRGSKGRWLSNDRF